MLKATTTVPGLRNNITGNEKSQAKLAEDLTLERLVIHNQMRQLMVNVNLR